MESHEASRGGSGEPPFDETLISGYIDGVLTQSERQRVRLEIERSEEIRALYEQLLEVREASLLTPFPVDDQWDERPRGLVASALRALGLFLWLICVVAGLTLVFVEPPFSEVVVVRSLVGTLLVGTVSLLLSVLIDRLTVSRRDIYTRVRK